MGVDVVLLLRAIAYSVAYIGSEQDSSVAKIIWTFAPHVSFIEGLAYDRERCERPDTLMSMRSGTSVSAPTQAPFSDAGCDQRSPRANGTVRAVTGYALTIHRSVCAMTRSPTWSGNAG
uniref:Uncharacterized protein n=1 Tax=Plectus sambesii TaxID=2011161 RepID=A0A914XH84_9BILA